MNSKVVLACAIGFATLQLAGCGGGAGSGTVISPVQVASLTTDGNAGDSIPGAIITSGVQPSASFNTQTLSRTTVRNDLSGNPIPLPYTMNYMVHDETPLTPAQGIIVLISGGYISTSVDSAPVSDVFFARSAHLFAEQDYKVITIQHASDYESYFPNASYDPNTPGAGGENRYDWYDDYRSSTDHTNDLLEVINAENSDNLPVILVGYGRGAISVAANATLSGTSWSVSGIVMVSPATYGGRAFLGNDPVPTDSIINVPTFITYHNDDTCEVFPSNGTTVPDAVNLLREDMIRNGNSIDAVALSGGFEAPENTDVNYNPCDTLTNHGFLGIESGTVAYITDWIDTL